MIFPTKTELVQLIVNETKNDPDYPWKDIAIDSLLFQWFVTGRSGSGLRLTDSGAVAFERANIAHYDIEFTPPQSSRGVIQWGKYTLILDKKVKCPYYIGVKIVDNGRKQPYIRLYDSRIAMMMTLYGDLQSYLESVK